MGKLWKYLLSLALLFACAGASAFDIRGLHIAMRTEVMTMDALKELASRAAAGGLNTIIMEWEATFPFQENATLCKEEAYSQDEVRDFIEYCGKLGIDVIPLQNCFGHCEYILRHERYGALRESGDDCSQVCPCREDKAREVFGSIFAEIAAMHPSKYIHIGADETRLLGVCPACKAKMQAEGKSKLFCDYVKLMCDVVRGLGRTPVIWADILTKYPEAAGDLPKDLVVLDWNYGWEINRFGDFEKLVSSGLEMWGAPSLRSAPDDIENTQWMKHFNNLRDYVDDVRKLGFKGIIETSWSDSGVYRYVKNSYGEVAYMKPLRELYPMSAFNILVDAFCEASASEDRFDPEDFIRRWCRKNLGLDEAGAGLMLDYFNMPQIRFREGHLGKLPEELAACDRMRERMKSLRPGKVSGQSAADARKQLDHFRLMLDIRSNCLEFLALKARFESPDFTVADRQALASELKLILKQCKRLQKCYCRLNKGYLKNPGDAFGVWEYPGEMENLYEILTNN